MSHRVFDRRRRARPQSAPAVALAVALCAASPAAATEFDEAVELRESGNAASAASQERVDAIADETEDLERAYSEVLRQSEALDVYNRQLAQLIESQNEELTSLQAQIDRVELVGRQITPLMLQMIEGLEAFIELDVPFLLEERRARAAALAELMGRSDVTEAEKYRRIMEAYQIENEYGRTIEAYEGELDLGGQTRAVNFLRLGRVSLIYQTLDGTEAGVWDRDAKTWTALGGDARIPIRQGLRIARKQAPPDLLHLPVPAAENAL